MFRFLFLQKGNEGESNRKEKEGSTSPLSNEEDADEAFSVALDEMFAMETIHPNDDASQYPDILIDAEFDEEIESDFPAHVATFLVEIEQKMTSTYS